MEFKMARKKIVYALVIALLLSSIQMTFGAVSFDIPVPEFTAMKADTQNMDSYLGYYDGDALINQSYYSDISGVANEESIIRMSALGVVDEYGETEYRPGENVSGYEAISDLVRMLQGEEAVMTRVYAQLGTNYTTEDIKKIMNQEYLTEAQNLGIVLNSELSYLDTEINREQLGMWVSRALGLAETNATQSLFTYSDWAEVNPQYRAMMETLVKSNIMPMKNDGSFGPDDKVTRGEMALITEEGIKLVYDQRNIVSNFGLVIGTKEETAYENDDTITSNIITVKNSDGAVTEIVKERHTKGSAVYNFPIFTGDFISESSYLKIGDQIEYIIMDDAVMYAEVISSDQILEIMSDMNEDELEYSVVHYGKISEIFYEDENINGNIILRERYRVGDFVGGTFDIVVDEDLLTGYKNDIITQKDGNLGGVDQLVVGDVLEYLTNENFEVVYINVNELETTTVAGTIREVTAATDGSELGEDGIPQNATMTIYGYDDVVYKFQLAPYASKTINDRYTEMDNYIYGMNVTAVVSNGYITAVNGESFASDPGYIPQYGKMRMGQVGRVLTNGFYIIYSNDESEYFLVSDDTKIMKEGNEVSFDAIKMGDEVKLYFDDIYTDEIAKVEIEAQDMLIAQIYKGEIIDVNEIKGEITLKNPQYLKNEDWEAYDEYTITFDISYDSEFYVGNQLLRFEDLEEETEGKDGYVVVKDVYGVEEAVKVSIKLGGENLVDGAVYEVDNTIREFELYSRENFNITDGTIMVKDGRVVSPDSLDDRDDVLVVSEYYRGSSNALVVKVVTAYDDIFDSIRIGAVEDVNTTTLTLKYHSQFSGNELNDVEPDESELYRYYTSTVITDVTGTSADPYDHEVIAASDFFDDEYARVENRSTDGDGLSYESYYAFMVVNEADNGIIAMNLRHKGLIYNQNIDDNVDEYSEVEDELNDTFEDAVLTRGIVTDKNEDWSRLILTDAHDWSEYTGQWVATKTDVYIEYTHAITIKSTTVKEPDDISAGDYVYIMRINDEALVIFIEY